MGCDGDLLPASFIDRTRILGARVEVVGDPERAWPKPGESIDVHWLPAFPSEPLSLTWGFAACTRAPVLVDRAFCSAVPFAVVAEQTAKLPPITARFTIPARDVLADTTRILVLGAICTRGQPVPDIERQTVNCQDGEGITLDLSIPLQLEELTNHQPTFGDFFFNNTLWPAMAAPSTAEGCAANASSAQLPVLSAQSDNPLIGISVPASARETFTTTDSAEERREVALVSHFTTLGAMERRFSVVEADTADDPANLGVAWDLKEIQGSVSEQGTLARFYFVLRDQRGGVTWSERYACVTP